MKDCCGKCAGANWEGNTGGIPCVSKSCICHSPTTDLSVKDAFTEWLENNTTKGEQLTIDSGKAHFTVYRNGGDAKHIKNPAGTEVWHSTDLSGGWEENIRFQIKDGWVAANVIKIVRAERQKEYERGREEEIERTNEMVKNVRIGTLDEVVDYIADLATGGECMKEVWECCGFHDALGMVLKRFETIKS